MLMMNGSCPPPPEPSYIEIWASVVGSAVGVLGAYLVFWLEKRHAQKEAQGSASVYWQAMRQVLIETIEEYFNGAKSDHEELKAYFKLWYSRASDIWNMLPLLAQTNPALIEEATKARSFITKHLSSPLLPNGDLNFSMSEQIRYLCHLKDFYKSLTGEEFKKVRVE